jgi:DNA-binding SARP family transcriptional activator
VNCCGGGRRLDPLCRIELLGGLRVWCGERPVTRFRSRKTGELLAYLACYPRREHPREVLIELFWPDCDLDAGRHSLNVALSSLRKELEPPGVPDGAVLHTDRFSVRLNPETVRTDIAGFETALRAAAAAPGAAQLRHLTAAVELYGGELLPGHYEDWIVPEQQRLEELYLQAVRTLIAQRREVGDLEGALRFALQGVAASGLREETHREVIRLYAEAGRHDEALRHYRELERRLARELDLSPSAKTRALVENLSHRDRSLPTPPAAAREVATKETARFLPEPGELEPVGGAMPLGSRYYVMRDADADFEAAVRRQDSIILVRGARQVGKTSLLARGLQSAREAGKQVALSHFQGFNARHLESPDAFLLALADDLVEQLDLDVSPSANWNPDRGANPNLRRFLRREVLARLDRPLVWGMDEVDRLFGTSYASDVFGLVRSWHDERALEPRGPWGSLTLALLYSTEAHLFITDLNQSPFNVGTRVEMDDFTREQVADLNRRHGSPLRSDEEVVRFYALLHGHPFLVRLGLHALTARTVSLTALEQGAGGDVFGPHLRRLLLLVEREPAVREAVIAVLEGGPCPSAAMFYRLRGAGILAGAGHRSARLRCPLYEAFIRENLS